MNRHVTDGRAGPSSPVVPAKRRDDRGMATLEWLLIVAAVAGLAALAVVLVQDYVEDTGDRMSNPDPRIVSARTMALTVEQGATTAVDGDFDTWGQWEAHFTNKCAQIGILYGDAEARVEVNDFERALLGDAFDAAAAGYAALGDASAATNSKAQVQCIVR